jgi:ABC-2 type transport system permease protein
VRLALLQIGHLAARSVVRTFRQPGIVIFPLVFPLVLVAVVASGLDPATALPGFPADSFLDFAIAIPFVQGALITSVNTATELGRDIEGGFLNRLALTPASGASIVLGHLGGAVALALVQALIYLGVGLAAGVDVKSGIPGMVVLIVLAGLIGLAFGTVGTFMALRTGSSEATQGLFPLLFVTFFLSSMMMPRHLIETDWFRTVATLNPVSYLIEGVRSLVITGWDPETLGLGFGFALALAAAGLLAAGATLRLRLTRT